jgi:hypothetical protein
MQHNVTTPARRLNNLGLNGFEEWLATKDSHGHTSVEPPIHLYYGAETSEAVDGVGSLPKTITSKIEMAAAVNAALGGKFNALMHDEGFWTALALLYNEAIFPVRNGKRQIDGDSNYVMPSIEAMRQNARGYRHRVFGPCYFFSRFGNDARAFLAAHPSTLGDALDAILYYNQAYASVIKAVDAMYVDVEGKFIGDGNSLDDHQKEMNLREGKIRDFIEHCRQIGYTQSLAHVSPEKLIASANKLEFAPQIKNYWKRREADDLPWSPASVRAAA